MLKMVNFLSRFDWFFREKINLLTVWNRFQEIYLTMPLSVAFLTMYIVVCVAFHWPIAPTNLYRSCSRCYSCPASQHVHSDFHEVDQVARLYVGVWCSSGLLYRWNRTSRSRRIRILVSLLVLEQGALVHRHLRILCWNCNVLKLFISDLFVTFENGWIRWDWMDGWVSGWMEKIVCVTGRYSSKLDLTVFAV